MATAPKSLDAKLAALAADRSGSDFIICYAADPDMGGGLRPTIGQGVSPQAWRDQMIELTKQADIDILLASVSTMDHLVPRQQTFARLTMSLSAWSAALLLRQRM